MIEFVRLADVAMAALRVRNGTAHDLPGVGKWAMSSTDRVIAIGPDEWLVMAEDADAAALQVRLASRDGVLVDVSGNRVMYRVAGPGACWFLAAGCSFDLERLNTGDAISTLLARAQVLLVAETSESFLVMPRRSFASYLEGWAATIDC